MESKYPTIVKEVSFLWRGKTYHAGQLAPDSPDVSYDYLHLGDGWRVHADNKRDRCELAGIAIYDTALPQSWYDDHTADMQARGGWAVWSYPAGNLFGEPVFADTIERLARETCAAMIAEEQEI